MGNGSRAKHTVTVAEIAERAGVSPGAVSFALNGRKGVSEDTRARILLVADELGWVPGAAAKSLTRKKTNDLAHTQIRDAAFQAEAAARGCEGMLLRTDYSPDEGIRATEQALASAHPPTAFVYDNDIMAIASLGVFARAGLRVPEDVSIIAWDDSVICRHTVPKLTTLSHDVVAFGAHAARRLFDVLAGAEPAAFLDSTPHLEVRESTAPAP